MNKNKINDAEVIAEDYFEWEIENWIPNLDNTRISPEFYAGGHQWNIKLYPNGDDYVGKKEFISLYLENIDIFKEKHHHIYSDFTFFIRNFDNYSCFTTKEKASIYYLNKNNDDNIPLDCMNKMDFYIRNIDDNNTNKKKKGKNRKKSVSTLIENEKVVIGAYIRVYKFNEEKYINELMDLIKDKGQDVIVESYYEWKIDNWDQLQQMEYSYSPEFKVGGLKWRLKLCSNTFDNQENIENTENTKTDNTSLYIENLDVLGYDSLHICAKAIFSIRHHQDYSYYIEKESSSFNYFSKENNISGLYHFIDKSILFGDNNNNINKSFVEDNKIVISIYIRLYEYQLEHYLDEMNSFIEVDNKKDKNEIVGEDCYEWEIEQWDEENVKSSSDFMIGGHLWNITLYPKGDKEVREKPENNGEIASIYLENVDGTEENFSHFYAQYILFIRNYNDYSCYIRKRTFSFYDINKQHNKIDFKIKNDKSFTSLIENGKTVIGAYIRVFKYNKEKYINELKGLIKEKNQNQYETIDDYYYEWKIDNYKDLKNEEYSPELIAGDYKWKIKLYTNNNRKDNNYVSVYLENMDITNENSIHICVNVVYVFRNYYDYSFYNVKDYSICHYYSKNKNILGINNFIKKSDLFIKNEISRKPLVEENGKTVVGVYLRLYKYKIVQYMDELKFFIHGNEKKNYEMVSDNYYEWNIENWSKMEYLEWSPTFMAGGYKWKINLWPNGYRNKKKYVSVYLENLDVSKEQSSHICAMFTLIFRHYYDYSRFISYVSSYNYFNNNKKESGCPEFEKRDYLSNKDNNSNKSIIEDDKFVIGAYIRVYKYNKKEQYYEELKSLIKNDKMKNNKIVNENYYEWQIESWNSIDNLKYSPEFLIGDYKWKIVLYLNSDEDKEKDNISLWLTNTDTSNDNSLHVCANFIFTLKNYNDYSCFIGKEDKSLNYFSKDRNIWGFKHFIKKSYLTEKNKIINNKSVIENDKIAIGTYIRIYKYKIEQYIEESKFFLKDENINNNKIIDESHNQWKINNWSKFENINYSPEFTIGGYKWKIKLCPHGDDDVEGNDNVSLYLVFADKFEEKPPPIFFNYVIALRNYNNSSCFIPYVSYYNNLEKRKLEFGNPKFIKVSDLVSKNKKNKSIIENDKVIISTYVWLYKDEKL
eukprot:jgi/Orpsp1_1/1183650/evm.model.c7180000086149.1